MESYKEELIETVKKLKALGYERLLPVQVKAIPAILRGSHTLIVAPTGSGKTEAALIPVLLMMKREGERGSPNLVYVTPLRALNRDLVARVERLATALGGFSAMVRHGDTVQRDRKRFLKSPPEIVITTPESLSLMLAIPSYRSIWSRVGWVIVDEIHELLESERGAELALVLQRLGVASKRRIQRIGLSATISRNSISEAASFLAYGEHVEVVEDLTKRAYDITIEVVESKNHDFWRPLVESVARVSMRSSGAVLVFTNTRSMAEYLGASLARVLGETMVAAHHGSLSRSVREEAERGLREGRKKVLVATSSMELGIDIGRIDLVVQALSPRQAIALVQRAGRSRHRFGETSKAVIVTSDNLYEVLESAVIARRAMAGEIEDIRGHRGPYDALAHQMVAMVLEGTAKSVDDVVRLTTATYTFANTKKEEVEEIAMHLDRLKILRYDGNTLRPSRRAKEYLFTVSMIPSERFYTVIDSVTDEIVGEVSDKFIEALLYAERPTPFILAGKAWRILDIDEERLRITVEPIAELAGEVPSWSGELIPVTREVAEEVCSIISAAMERGDASSIPLVSGSIASKIVEIAKRTKEMWGFSLSKRLAVIEAYRGEEGVAILHACLGSRGNFALALLLQKIIESSGVQVSFEYMPYAIAFSSSSPNLAHMIASAIREACLMKPEERRALVTESIEDTQAYVMRYVQVAKRLGVISQKASVTLGVLREMIKSGTSDVVDKETMREILHEKLDMEALDAYLSSLQDVRVVVGKELSPLSMEVLRNPYMSRGYTESMVLLPRGHIYQLKKAHLESRDVILLCTQCGHEVVTKVKHMDPSYRCGKCRSIMIAILPESDWGREMANLMRRYIATSKEKERGHQHPAGARLSGEDRKKIEQLYKMAELYASYAEGRYGRHIAMALAARGVGPERAKKIMEAYFNGGEEAFFEELLKAEQNYITTRKYWDS